MHKTKINLKVIFMFVASIFILASFSFAFAAFYVTTDTNLELDNGGVDVAGPSTISLSNISNTVFKNPGDSKELSVSIKNSSSNTYLKYYYKLSLGVETSTGLENAIFVYFNNNFMGTLTTLCNLQTKFETILDDGGFLLPAETYNTADKIKFVLHNGADGSYIDVDGNLHTGTNTFFDNAKFNVSIELVSKSIDYQKYIFVKTEDEFKSALDDVNLSTNEKTIVLSNSITLTKPYEIKENITIDLLGHNLVLGAGSALNIVDDVNNTSKFVVNITNSRTSAVFTPADNVGKININSANAYLNIDNSAKDYASLVTVTNVDSEAVLNYLATSLQQNLKLGVLSGDSVGVPILENAKYYFDSKVTMTNSAGLNVNNFVVSYPGIINATRVGTITLSCGGVSKDAEFKVIGNNEDTTNPVVDRIVSEDLAHVVALSDGIGLDSVSYDIYLPTSVKRYNATISWWSSNEKLISPSGKVPPSAQGLVNIVANININGKIYQRSFELYVVKQTEEMLFQYLLARIGTIKLTKVYNPNDPESYKYLPIVNADSPYDYRKMYTDGNDIRLRELDYGPMAPIYYFLSLDYKKIVDSTGQVPTYDAPFIYLNQATYSLFAQVPITGYFNGDCDNDGIPNSADPDYTPQKGFVGVEILLGDDEDLQDGVFKYIQSHIDSHSVLGNMLKTRKESGVINEKGDFSLIDIYMGYDIAYSVPDHYKGGTYSVSGIHGRDISFYPVNFPAEDTRVPILTTISYNGLNPGYDPSNPDSNEYETYYDSKNLFISIPGAVHNKSNGFNDEKIFYSVKLQVLQQLPDVATIDGTNYITDATTYQDIVATKDYILRYDISNTKTLMFVYDPNGKLVYDDMAEEKYKAVIEWATSTTNLNQRIGDVPTIDINPDYAWLYSDGSPDISDVESTAIVEFCNRFDCYEELWKEKIWVKDNVLTEYELSSLEAILTDIGYPTLIAWATGTTTDTVRQAFIDANVATIDIPTEILDIKADGKTTISEDEQKAILAYCSSRGYTKYLSVWQGEKIKSTEPNYNTTEEYKNYCINLNRKDQELKDTDQTALNNFIQTDNNLETEQGIITWATESSATPTVFNLTFQIGNEPEISIPFNNESKKHYNVSGEHYIESYVSHTSGDNVKPVVDEMNIMMTFLILNGYYPHLETEANKFIDTYYKYDWWYVSLLNIDHLYQMPQDKQNNLKTYIRNRKYDQGLNNLFAWATGTAKKPAKKINNKFVGTQFENIKSDGLLTITEDERQVILYYAANFANSVALTHKADDNCKRIIEWATGNTKKTLEKVFANNADMITWLGKYEVVDANGENPRGFETIKADGKPNITDEEFLIIETYYLDPQIPYNENGNHSYPNFEAEFNKYIDLSYWDDELTEEDKNKLYNVIKEASNMEEYNKIINWMIGFGETKANIQASQLGIDKITTNLNFESDGLTTVYNQELEVLKEYVNNLGVTQEIKDSYFSYLGTCIDLSSSDRVLSQDDKDVLLDRVRETMLHNDINELMDWATGNKAYPAGFLVPSLPKDIGLLESDGKATVSQNELQVMIQYCYDNGYFRLAKELETNGFIDEAQIKQYSRYYYVNVGNLDNKIEGLKYFDGLTRLVIKGNEDGQIISIDNTQQNPTAKGDAVLETIVNNMPNLYRLDLRYCNISSIKPMVNLNKLTHIDVRGNTLVKDITLISSVNPGNIKYFNIDKTNVNFHYSECIIVDNYFKYMNAHSNNVITYIPTCIYTKDGVATIYVPPKGLTENDIIPMYYCFLLKEISEINTEFLQLPNKVWVIEQGVPTSYDLKWEVVSGNLSIESIGNGMFKVKNTTIDKDNPTAKGFGILSLTIQREKNGVVGKYTRYFNINLTNPYYKK